MPQILNARFSLNCLLVALLLFVMTLGAYGQEASIDEPSVETTNTLPALKTFVELKKNLQRDIKVISKQLGAVQSDAEKNELKQQLDKLQGELQATNQNFEDIAAGVDVSSLRKKNEKKFDFQEELFSLIKPAIDEMKSMTAHVRQKSELKEKIEYFQQRLPVIEQALANSGQLEKAAKDKALGISLQETADVWEKERAFMQSELQAAQLQLEKLLASETSITEASQSYFKSFFQKRGLYLAEAFLVVVAVILLSRFSISGMRRYLPGFRMEHRSFRIRLVELIHRMLTILMVILGPMVVFYLVEDWVLFSLGILLLLGLAWTLRQALPLYWSQIQLFLNIGPVREGERILMDGLPWRVQQINVYCKLINPVACISQRVPIADIVGLKSRPCGSHEPWFPCKQGDWVILTDGTRGKVIGISPEFVQIVQRGGAQITYQTGDFLAASPRNLACNFRIKETLGISYSLQQQSTTSIPDILAGYIQQRIEEEGYGEKLLNLRVEFALANSSSLDLAIMADFDGELGDLYNRLRRAIQRWGVDACSKYGWEIPFPQMAVSGTLSQDS